MAKDRNRRERPGRGGPTVPGRRVDGPRGRASISGGLTGFASRPQFFMHPSTDPHNTDEGGSPEMSRWDRGAGSAGSSRNPEASRTGLGSGSVTNRRVPPGRGRQVPPTPTFDVPREFANRGLQQRVTNPLDRGQIVKALLGDAYQPFTHAATPRWDTPFGRGDMNPYGPTGPWAGYTDMSGMYPTEPVVRMPAPEVERSMARPMGASGSVPNPLGLLADLIGIAVNPLSQAASAINFDYFDSPTSPPLDRYYQTFMGG